MKIDLDVPVNIGDSIFFCDELRPEAKVVGITISYVDYSNEPNIIIEWAQYDTGPEDTELWDEGEVDLSQLGAEFWLTYEDMLRANKAELIVYQLVCDKHLRTEYGQEMDRCDIKERIGCDGCPYLGKCEYYKYEHNKGGL